MTSSDISTLIGFFLFLVLAVIVQFLMTGNEEKGEDIGNSERQSLVSIRGAT
jgi:hypothetical protein